ncbi:hypothetical protein BGZ98_000110 [Dissophora globulifera]|nr:hypothetical protein BGZ98_000110 [Dissophora globulifera]
MDTTTASQPQVPRLPVDCIRCIVSQLDGDIFTLARILTVNRTFFEAAVPVLYRDPYRALEAQIRKQSLIRGRGWPSFSTSLPAKKLLYLLLLSCRRADDLAPFLTPDWSDPISPLVSYQPLMAAYIDFVEDYDYDRWMTTLKHLAPELDTTMESMANRLLRLLFLDHHKEQVQMLSIPITHLEPYKPLIPHLKRLQRIRFYEDDLDGTQDQDEEPEQHLPHGAHEPVPENHSEPAQDDTHPAEPTPVEVTGQVANAEAIVVTEDQERMEVEQADTLDETPPPVSEVTVDQQMTVQSEREEEPATEDPAIIVETNNSDGNNGDNSGNDDGNNDGNNNGNNDGNNNGNNNDGDIINTTGGTTNANGTLEGNNEGAANDNVETNNNDNNGGNNDGGVGEGNEQNNGDIENENEPEVEIQENEPEVEIQETSPPAPVYDPTPRAVAFIKSHRAFFNPGRVPEAFQRFPGLPSRKEQFPCGYGLVDVEPPRYWINPNRSEDPAHNARYIQLLDALQSPSIVDFGNWRQFSSHIDKVPLSGVKRLRYFCEEREGDAPWSQSKVLKRCRGLERFSAPLQSGDVFAWALEEQKDRATYEGLIRNGVASVATSLSQGRSHGGYFGPGPAPVPLRHVTFRRNVDEYVAPALKDICSVFNSTLETIHVRTLWAVDKFDLSIFCDMPRLTILDIHLNRNCAFLNSASFLKGCQSIRILRLVDNEPSTNEVSGGPVVLQEAWHLPHLKTLTLVGTICEGFNYESLMHSPEIETIRMEHTIDDIGVRKISEEYQAHLSRASWSWNWDLPRLSSMMLKGQPAHLFRFCLLQGCPRLQELQLDLGSVPRTVSMQRDMISVLDNFQSPLRSLVMKGRWIMTESSDLFRCLAASWLNGAHYLKMDAAVFFSNKSMLDALRSIRSLRKSVLRKHRLSNYEAWELGLEEVGFKCSREWDVAHRIEVSVVDARKRRELAQEKLRKEEEAAAERAQKLHDLEQEMKAEAAAAAEAVAAAAASAELATAVAEVVAAAAAIMNAAAVTMNATPDAAGFRADVASIVVASEGTMLETATSQAETIGSEAADSVVSSSVTTVAEAAISVASVLETDGLGANAPQAAVLETADVTVETTAAQEPQVQEQLQEEVKERARSETVDSACELDQEETLAAALQKQREEEEAAQEKEQAEKEDFLKILQTVYVFKGKRYHFKEE